MRNDIADVEELTASSGSGPAPERDAEVQMRRLWPQVTAMLDLVDDQAFVVRTLRKLSSAALNLEPYGEMLDDLAADSDYAYRVAVRLEARYWASGWSRSRQRSRIAGCACSRSSLLCSCRQR